MADTTTINYGFTLIGIGGSRDGWGQKLNANFEAIDTRIKTATDAAGAATAAAGANLPKAGGTVTGAITREGAGVHAYFAAAGMTGGRVFVAPASGADPTSQPGDIWLGY